MYQQGYWRRQRGISNSKGLEHAFFVYKGRVPQSQPKERKYVDAGSPLFNSVRPILPMKSMAYVSKAVRETSLASMIGVARDTDAVVATDM